MKSSEIAQLLDEPACAHNQKAKSGCAKSQPGATAGGCAFDGAQIALLPIADVAHIVHGSIACAGSSWDNRGTRSSGSTLFRLGMTTDLTEQDVIMGRGEKRLLHAIKQAIESYQPAAVFVYNTCIPALTGDDLEATCKAAAQQWGTPVVPIDAAGFYGTKNLGNRIAGEAMVKFVCGTREPDPIPPQSQREGITVHDVALIGEYNIAGELWSVVPLLDELGLRLLGTLSGDSRFREIQTLHRSQVNMMVCSKAMVNVARKLEQSYGTPWFEGSFYGVGDVSQALRDFARHLNDPSLTARTEALIAREEAAVKQQLQPWRERLRGKRVLLYTGGVKSWSVVAALQDLGLVVVATGTKKSTEEDKARIRELMGEEALMLDEGSPKALLDLIQQQRVDILIAGGRNQYTALKGRVPFLDINQEREFGYAGYVGMVELARQLTLTLESPVWAAVRQPPPWLSSDSAPANTSPPAVEILKRNKALSVSPLKSNPAVGAALAFLGIDRAMPMLHGSQGCTAFGKVFLVRHFREPIPLQTTAMDQVTTVMGSEESIVEGLKTIADKSRPALIGLPTTGLAETQGSDVGLAVRQFRQRYPQFDSVAVVPVSTPDYSGSLESGFAQAVEAMITHLVPQQSPKEGAAVSNTTRQINVLVGASLTTGDLEALRELIEAFGLEPLLLPDLADSLDGHLGDEGFTPLTRGGTPVAAFRQLAQARATLVVGYSMFRAADRLQQQTGVPDYRLGHLMGLAAVDALMGMLQQISGQPIPPRLLRQRQQLLDAMLDSHFMIGMSRFAVAAEPDLLVGWSHLLTEMGGEVVAAVAPHTTPALQQSRCAAVKIGDLADLEMLARQQHAELLIGSSHAAESAERLGIPLLRSGFPLYDEVGGYQTTRIGYRGGRQTLFDLANRLLQLERGEIHPYRSCYATPLERQQEVPHGTTATVTDH